MQNRNLAKEIFTRKHDIASSSIFCGKLKVFLSDSKGKGTSIMSAIKLSPTNTYVSATKL